MKKVPLYLAIFISGCSASVTQDVDIQQFVVSPDSMVEGKKLDEYANIWWQWTNTMSDEVSPLKDRTGKYCDINQHGEVWFLAGGYGNSKIRRTCTVPEGKHLFFPIINMVYWASNGESLPCATVKRGAALNNDELLSINVEIDGYTVPNASDYRFKSDSCFDLLGLVPEEYGAPKVYPSATDGYWLMLKPLERGEHTIKFNAQYNRPNGSFGQMAQDIEYNIIVQ